MNKVLILLSTYNGENYLREQLDSIYAQEDVCIHILVRDDGSKDSTLDILHEYESQKGRITVFPGKNLGAARSFYELMRIANEKYPNFDYYAFSDQDDIWFPNKLFVAVSELDKSNNIYKFYYCGYQFVDKEGHVFGVAHPSMGSYKEVLFRNPCIGCSQVFNYKLMEKANDIQKVFESGEYDIRDISLHDVWMAKIAFFFDAFIVADSNYHFNYRQHETNVTHSTGISIRKKVLQKIAKYTKENPNSFSKKALLLYKLEGASISSQKLEVLIKAVCYRKSIFASISFAFYYSWQFRRKPSISLYVFALIITRHF